MCFLGLADPGLLGLVLTPEKLKPEELVSTVLPLVVGSVLEDDENENPPVELVAAVDDDPKLNPDEPEVAVVFAEPEPKLNPEDVVELAAGAAPVPNLKPPPAPMVMTASGALAASFSFCTSSSYPGLGPSHARHWILELSFLVRHSGHSQLAAFWFLAN